MQCKIFKLSDIHINICLKQWKWRIKSRKEMLLWWLYKMQKAKAFKNNAINAGLSPALNRCPETNMRNKYSNMMSMLIKLKSRNNINLLAFMVECQRTQHKLKQLQIQLIQMNIAVTLIMLLLVLLVNYINLCKLGH